MIGSWDGIYGSRKGYLHLGSEPWLWMQAARDELEGCYVDQVKPGFYLIREA